MGVKHGNLADAQVEKSGSPPAILGVRMPGLPLNLYTELDLHQLVNIFELLHFFQIATYAVMNQNLSLKNTYKIWKHLMLKHLTKIIAKV